MNNDDPRWEIRAERWQESPPDEVDHVISDPPFDEATFKGGLGNKNGEIRRLRKSFDGIDPYDVGPALVSRCRRWCICFCAFEQFGRYQEAVGTEQYVRSAIWLKTNPTTQISGDRPAQPGEGIAIMHPKGAKRWNRGGDAGVWECASPRPGWRDWNEHETQKPLDLMIDLVESFTDPGDLIWDPYCGSGTTGVAAILTGRDFLGHEKQKRYAEIALKRLKAEERGLKLEDAEAGQTSILDQT